MPAKFNVSQVRVAAACPRILYFDFDHARVHHLTTPKTTRLWQTGGDFPAAGGQLFHEAIEKFNQEAGNDRAVRVILTEAKDKEALGQALLREVYTRFVKQPTLMRFNGQGQQNFIGALRRYLHELAEVLYFLLTVEKMPVNTVLEYFFSHTQRYVNAQFDFGAHGAVRVTGILDYLFFDPRAGHLCVIDYKLTPAQEQAKDLFQASVYALLHHRQFASQPAAAVLYLYPERYMPRKTWAEIAQEQHKIFDLIASMAQWVEYNPDRNAGLRPPGEAAYCVVCPWVSRCRACFGQDFTGGQLADVQEIQPAPKSTPPLSQPTVACQHNDQQDAPVGLCLGHSKNGTEVCLPASAIATHTAIVGAAGSGKTWLAKVFAEEAILQGVPVIALDPQGDLVQFIRQCQAAETQPPAWQARHMRYWQTVEPRVFTPGSSHAQRLSLNPLRLCALEDLVHIENPQRRAEELDGLFDAAAANVVALANAGGETDAQQAFLFQLLKRLTRAQAQPRLPFRAGLELADVAAGIARPEAVGVEQADLLIKKADREKLARKLNAMLHGPAAKLFSGGAPLDVDALRRPATPGRVPLNVIYLNALTDDSQKQFFVAALASEIYRWMITRQESHGGNALLFYLDEARDYMPAGAKSPPAKNPLIRLFTQGRKYGVGCLLCTQSPRSVDYNVFGNCSSKLIGRLESAQDSSRVAEWFTQSGPAPQWVKGRNGAERGSFVGRWPGIAPPWDNHAWLGRALFSHHEGAWPPDRVENELAQLAKESTIL